MISYFEAAMSVCTGIKKLESYVVDDEETVAGTFSRTADPEIAVIYVQGGTTPLALDAASGEITTRIPGAFVWRWLPLWLNRNVAIVTVDFPRKYAAGEMPPFERTTAPRINTLLEVIARTRKALPGARMIGYGHSYGSLEMSELAKVSSLEKIIIGSGCWNPGLESEAYKDAYIGSLEPADVKMPVLVVQHKHDLTSKCTYAEASKAMGKFNGLGVGGGMPHLGVYGDEPGPHFFLSQENEVVRNIVDWARAPYHYKTID
jgi:hypothetical protein